MILKVKTSFTSDLLKKSSHLKEELQKEIDKKAVKLVNRLKTKIKNTIRVKLDTWSGDLLNSVRITKKWNNNSIYLGTEFDRDLAPYVKTHVGTLGTWQTISTKNRRYLTIPMKGGPAYHTGLNRHHKEAEDFDDLQVTKFIGKYKYLVQRPKGKGKTVFVFQLRSKNQPVKIPRVIDIDELRESFHNDIEWEFKNIIINTLIRTS